jgi:branched-chain amino acid transport system substrate-binding protein
LRATHRPILIVVLVLAAATALAAGCGTEQGRGGRVPGGTLTIFSSLPLQGAEAGRARSIVNAEKLALEEAGGHAGKFDVSFSFADDATAAGDTPGWKPGKTADNARAAVQNLRTIGYIGDFDSGASAISLPITNGAGFVQISPAATAVGLTKFVPGAEKGEPDKFYPAGDRTFARVVPADDVQVSAAATWARQLGAKSVFVLGDKSLEGDGRSLLFQQAAHKSGLRVAGDERMDPRANDYRDLAAKIRATQPDAVYFGGGAESNALQLWRDLHAALPGARLIGSHELLVPSFYARLGAAEPNTYITSVAQDPTRLPPRGRRFLRDYRRQFGSEPDPYAAYGHAAMALLLDAIRRAGGDGDDRGAVTREVLSTENRQSVLGTYSIDGNGDTTLRAVSGYRVAAGLPVSPTRLAVPR